MRLVADGDEPSDEDVVAAWWRRSALIHGDGSGTEADWLAAAGFDWAHVRVRDVLWFADAEDAIAVLDDLLAWPAADPTVIGCGPLEELLSDRGAEAAPLVAQRCAVDPTWRAAARAVGVSPGDQDDMPDLAPYLS